MERLKLNLGCGNVIIPGAVNVDMRNLPGVNLRWDLNRLPWPWSDGQAKEIIANHIVEHLDSLTRFMDEAWRLLVPGGTLYIEVPDAADLDLSWCDPGHKRPYRVHTFVNYFTIPGIDAHHETNRPWQILYCASDGHVIRFHGMPVSPEGEDAIRSSGR